MVLAREVYDWTGTAIIDVDKALDDSHLTLLKSMGVREILVHDERVGEVIVSPLIPEEVEGKAATLLRQILDGNRGVAIEKMALDLASVDRVVRLMMQDIQHAFIGNLNLDGCLSLKNYDYIHGAKVIALSLLLGEKAGYSHDNLAKLGISACLQNIGYVLLPQGMLVNLGPLTEEQSKYLKKHPEFGYHILFRHGGFAPCITQAVWQHHERWDGSGYPQGLKGEGISQFARIIAVADTYHALVSQRPWRRPLSPPEAARFISSHSGQLFDPAVVQILLRSTPFCPEGTVVKVNTGEIGMVTDANIGHICRPVVRICYDHRGLELMKHYDIDLTSAEHQNQWVAEIDPEIPEISESGLPGKAGQPGEKYYQARDTVMQSTQDTSAADKFSTRKTQVRSFSESRISVSKVEDWRELVEAEREEGLVVLDKGAPDFEPDGVSPSVPTPGQEEAPAPQRGRPQPGRDMPLRPALPVKKPQAHPSGKSRTYAEKVQRYHQLREKWKKRRGKA